MFKEKGIGGGGGGGRGEGGMTGSHRLEIRKGEENMNYGVKTQFVRDAGSQWQEKRGGGRTSTKGRQGKVSQ